MENNNRKITGKSPNSWMLNNALLNKHGSNRKSQGKLDNILKNTEIKIYQNLQLTVT